MTTKIVTVAPEYTLKFDEKEDELRDRTHQELVRDFGKNAKIRCPCMDREYIITSQWCKSHFNSQKHQNWKTVQQKEHIKKHGHCISAEQIVDQQSKEIRELKINIHKLTCENVKKDNKIKNLSEKLNEVTNENSLYNQELERQQEEIDTYKEQCQSSDKEIITLTKLNDKLKKDILNLRKDKFKIVEKPAWKS
jgi:chromosome segregation ATPase